MKMTDKNSGEKIYHIYLNKKCVYHSLRESEFQKLWLELNRLADLMSSNSELSYEELVLNKEVILNSSY